MNPATIILSIAFAGSFSPTLATASPVASDTSIIQHTQDGKLLEWPSEKFTVDNDTKLKYAIDNDSRNLYVALLIPDYGTQMKMMRTGMTIYIDLKAKKKEGRGIEFPVKPDKGETFTPTEGARPARNDGEEQDASKRNTYRIMMRNSMAIKQLNTIKIFGFGESDPVQQVLDVPGSIQVTYKCDTAEAMEIEYRIPLSLLGDAASLHEKLISIGCKIHAMEMRAGGFSDGGGGMGGMGGGGMRGGGGGRMGGGRGGMGGGGMGGMDRESMMREQSFWVKYTLTGK